MDTLYLQTLRTEIRHKRGSNTPVFEFAVILQLKSNVCCHLTRLLETSTLKGEIHISFNALRVKTKRLEAARTTLTIQACSKMFHTLTLAAHTCTTFQQIYRHPEVLASKIKRHWQERHLIVLSVQKKRRT